MRKVTTLDIALLVGVVWVLFGSGASTLSGLISGGREAVGAFQLPTAQARIVVRPLALPPVSQPLVGDTPLPSLTPTAQLDPTPLPTNGGVAQNENVSTTNPAATPLPEPSDPAFAASFKEPPACSPFIGYISGPCAKHPAQATKLPEPGEDGFVESFK